MVSSGICMHIEKTVLNHDVVIELLLLVLMKSAKQWQVRRPYYFLRQMSYKYLMYHMYCTGKSMAVFVKLLMAIGCGCHFR
ncbi:hypothetical protein RJT34_24164 [Clitoria ternatea]|uniref:Uncharacterized protein n=1 Tax=Clitoria ternatea TaxID=43366 RepID=A0AAN9FMK0_CLITE